MYAHLHTWERAPNYWGEDWTGYYSAGVGQSRDSEALERSNFAVTVRELEKVPEPHDWPHDESPVQVVRENHWAVGWVEWIAIHPDAKDHLQVADKLAGKLADYPILDEFHYSEVENDDCVAVWEDCFNTKDRLNYLRDHSYSGGFRELRAAVNGDWGAASGILHYPSEILS